jgi:hypothetical protein
MMRFQRVKPGIRDDIFIANATKVRRAWVTVPSWVALPEVIFPAPPLAGDLPAPRETYFDGQTEVRRHGESSSLRMTWPLTPDVAGYKRRLVTIEKTQRAFAPFKSRVATWRGFAELVHVVNPTKQVEREMNKRSRDWKHRFRDTDDDSYVGALTSMRPRDLPLLNGAILRGDMKEIADTAIVLSYLRRRG